MKKLIIMVSLLSLFIPFWTPGVAAQEVTRQARFRCWGEVISTTETSEGNYEVVAQIQFELETRRGEVLHGGGLALTGTATASPSGAFNCRGRGEVTAVPVEIEGRPDETTDLWQIELEATQFRVFLEEGSADDLSSLTILGLSGTASASPSGA